MYEQKQSVQVLSNETILSMGKDLEENIDN